MLFSIKPLFVLAAVNYVVLAQGPGAGCFWDVVDRVCQYDEYNCICTDINPTQKLYLVSALVETCLPEGYRNPVYAEELINNECAAISNGQGPPPK
ncbi:hypothetical protein BD410DRAFT_902917 [Rickenella mellea]|uniref:Extracellular membrane protein CFEM domain-containing protein n=1 Tax=Rickenella mellea TaxID=50990 RepID=A0A4Y7PI87_9AGAM|nr:hypothetical protein BD410DRAFT_902917 [Rickenella mellea]